MLIGTDVLNTHQPARMRVFFRLENSMARQEIILGTPPTGLGGDPPRVASMKINAMTLELYEKNAKLGSAAFANLVGTVAEGAIIEQGSNAKGNFTKFADGTLITWGSQLFNVQTLAGQGAGFNETDQPASFVPGSFRSAVSFNFFGGANKGAPLLYGSMQYYSNGLNNIYVGINMGFSPAAVHPSFLYGPLTSQSHEISYQTIGRWK